MPTAFPTSESLLQRAERVIPMGVWGHNRFPAFLGPGRYPIFARRAEGAHFEDVDGRRYIDYICGYGAMITGFANPAVDAAAAARTLEGDCLNQPTETSVELAERLTELVDGMAWAAFGKNGTDAVSTAFLIARAQTGRAKIVCARGAYHGSHSWLNWCNIGAGRPAEDSAMVLQVDWNDLEGLRALFAEHGNDIAAVLMTPFHHPFAARAELPDEDWWPGIRSLCDASGALVIVDDVRAGFRLDLAGSHRYFGFSPDLVCFSKAIANTHPLSVVMGAEDCRGAAEEIFAAGTFWNAAAPMAAALTNLDLLCAPGRFARMHELAGRLSAGLVERAATFDFALEVTGPATIPTVTIEGDDDFTLMTALAEGLVARGSFVHPTHNWFFSAAHEESDVEATLRHADETFAAMRDESGG